MPDISNTDILKLVCRVIKKVDTLEEKLDKVLYLLTNKKNNSEETTSSNYINYKFKYTPINDDEELERVSKAIEENELYRKNLLCYMETKQILTLEHIFTETFLLDYSLRGLMGKKKLAGVVPYEQIYAYLKYKEGETEKEVSKGVTKELDSIRRKVYARKHREEKKIKDNNDKRNDPITGGEKEEESLEQTSNDTNFEMEQVFVEQIDAEKCEADVKNEDINEDINESDDEYFSFSPINNKKKLDKVSEKIEMDPRFLKNLRISIVDDSENGKCTLEQLFTIEFLQNYSLHGRLGNTNGNFMENGKLALSLTAPYKHIYLYLRTHLGQTSEEIEIEALSELKKLRNRMAGRRKLKRRRGELPPFKSPKVLVMNASEDSS